MNVINVSLLSILIAASVSTATISAQTNYSVLAFGAKADGKTDDTAAFQKAMNAASQAGGGTVHAPRGNYFFAGHLNMPKSVTLEGIWQSVPSHIGLRSPGQLRPTDDGTTFLVTENATNENGAPFITLNDNCTLKGVVIYYPNQKTDGPPDAYPWAIAMRGRNPAVLDVELLNPYNGIDASLNERHLIRNVEGQPLRRGIYIDVIYDIGRLENIHFNPWWNMSGKVYKWQQQHGEAFIFGRSDWQYVLNTFCFGYNIGYRFIHTAAGECNGNFLGIGADDSFTALQVDDCSNLGVLISNGEFVSFHGPDPTMIDVKPTNHGSIRFVNCAFWGPCHQIAKVAGKGTVGFSDCTFAQWDRNNKGLHAIQASGGNLLVRGCEFQMNKPQIELSGDVRRAVISENIINGKLQITNRTPKKFIISNNAED